MQLKTQKMKLNKKPVIISQASRAMIDLSEELIRNAETNPPADKVLDFLNKTYYPFLAPYTNPQPTLEEASRFELAEWDKWFTAVKTLNPRFFTADDFTEEEVTFSDGSKIIVQSKRPSVWIRCVTIEAQADLVDLQESPRKSSFRLLEYPLLAGCSIGDVPDEDTAYNQMSEADQQLWYDAAKRQIPEWFSSLEQIALQNQEHAREAQKKSEITV